jgi:GNAT superfamily N-acetyltransferase
VIDFSELTQIPHWYSPIEKALGYVVKQPGAMVSFLGFLIGFVTLYLNHRVNVKKTRKEIHENHEKMLIDIDKVLIERPELWEIYDAYDDGSDKPTDGERSRREQSFIYQHLNTFNLVFDYYRNFLRKNWSDRDYWNSWDSYIKQFFRESSGARRLLQEKRNTEITEGSFWEYSRNMVRAIDSKFVPMEKGDLPAAVKLLRKVFPYRELKPPFRKLGHYIARDLSASLDESRKPGFLASQGLSFLEYYVLRGEGGTIYGVSGLYRQKEDEGESSFWIGWLGVDKDYRQLGLGSRLLSETIRKAEAMGARALKVYSSSHPNEARANEMYSKLSAEEPAKKGDENLFLRLSRYHYLYYSLELKATKRAVRYETMLSPNAEKLGDMYGLLKEVFGAEGKLDELVGLGEFQHALSPLEQKIKGISTYAIVLAYEGDSVVGMISGSYLKLSGGASVLFLGYWAVRPGSRRLGLGKGLFEEMSAFAARRAAEKRDRFLGFVAESDLQGNRAAMRSLGFKTPLCEARYSQPNWNAESLTPYACELNLIVKGARPGMSLSKERLAEIIGCIDTVFYEPTEPRMGELYGSAQNADKMRDFIAERKRRFLAGLHHDAQDRVILVELGSARGGQDEH